MFTRWSSESTIGRKVIECEFISSIASSIKQVFFIETTFRRYTEEIESKIEPPFIIHCLRTDSGKTPSNLSSESITNRLFTLLLSIFLRALITLSLLAIVKANIDFFNFILPLHHFYLIIILLWSNYSGPPKIDISKK